MRENECLMNMSCSAHLGGDCGGIVFACGDNDVYRSTDCGMTTGVTVVGAPSW